MIDPTVHVVFDLDDTLFLERDYSCSALQFVGDLIEVAFGEKNVGPCLLEKFENGETDPIEALFLERGLPIAAKACIISAMRGHKPKIKLSNGTNELLAYLLENNIKWSILTDGRSLTQRLKISALGLVGMSDVYISEERGVKKPNLEAFTQIMIDHPTAGGFWYVADNPAKDFIAPNILGWNTFMLLDSGSNIHPQPANLPREFSADAKITNLVEILYL